MGNYRGLLERLDKALGIQAPPVVMVALLEFVEGVLPRIKGLARLSGLRLCHALPEKASKSWQKESRRRRKSARSRTETALWCSARTTSGTHSWRWPSEEGERRLSTL